MTRTPAQAPRKRTKPQQHTFCKNAFNAFLKTLLFAAVFLLVGSIAVTFLPDPASATAAVGILCAMLSAFTGGIIAGKIHRSAPALCGLTNGALLLALMLVGSLFFRERAAGYSVGTALALHIGILLLSIVGATLGVQQRSKKTKRARRR